MAKFSIEDNFFIIDSNNLDDIRTKLYGYCISEYSNFTDSLDNKINLNGLGAYIYVFVDENRITINQDYIGSYGLYLFQDKDYFALSNSFIYLVDYIKTTHKITLNKDYANYLLICNLCSEIYEDTIVNEIKMLDRSAFIEIDKINKSLKVDYIDYKENTVELGSDESFDILDNWYNRWINIIKNLKLETNNIATDLSGGMDSRLVFLLFLGSDLDLNDIEFNTYTDKIHCFAEDFEIASQIAKDYGFTLNKELNIEKYQFSLEDIINISFYTKLCFHKEMYWKESKYKKCKTSEYKFCGYGGECIRDYLNFETVSDFIKDRQKKSSIYPKEVRAYIGSSVEKVINKSIIAIKNKLNFKKIDDSDLLINLYRETRCRNHYGKAIVEYSSYNIINIAPLLDSELSKLKLNSIDCRDSRLLLSLIFTRYCPNLLNYKFEGNRIIDEDTIEFAKKINNIKPFKKDNRIAKKYKIIKSSDLYPQIEKKINIKKDELSPSDFLLNIFHSPSFKYLFSIYYNPKILDSIYVDIKKRGYHPLKHAYAIIGITKIINDILISERTDKFDNVFDEINNFTNNREKIYDFCNLYYSLNETIKTKNEQLQQKNEQIKTKNEQLQQKNEAIAKRDNWIKDKNEQIKNRDLSIKQKNSEIQNLHNQNNIQDQVIKQLQNSWSYRIGRLFTYPLSIPLEFYRYIRDYNLIKKSDLFDSEYYLSQNEDVKNAKMDPIKHYLQFGWKEGRNPSAKFNGNEYLNKSPDVRVAGICPLVHYIRFGKEEK